MKSLKTPLRYPGGKSRACTKLDRYLPNLENYREFREPFLGGGSVAIHITKKYPDIKIWVSDLYEPLVNFWKHLQTHGDRMAEELISFKKENPTPDKARHLFEESKRALATGKNYADEMPLFRAIAFYILNKCSFSGLTESSSFSAQASDSNFSMRGIEKLPEYSKLIQNWIITDHSYEYLLNGSPDVFIYLDPPYEIKDNLYGNKGSMHKGFDHDLFAKRMDFCDCDSLISYNSSQLIKDRFSNWSASEFDHTYTMRSVGEYMRQQQDRKELVLMNY
jgi:DNA adenine methylase